ncbi:type IV pilus assembly protein PilC [Methylomarinovum caldicuralii]|uniref:Type IV pilus assembly protein PilC n=1 Tax=Methylomarinovum caldicuralii TaxID=438856 RepID=A0AAU9CRG7_9GAMM|nr:type II secretion system F family protein [Methylomarinovum caldicuralii]BCX80467.1 type IV pilus assembly protein PilC [Methylomarinovum caldicuralii]
MPRYRYTAVDSQGRRCHGLAEADNEDMLESRLGARRLTLIRARVVRERRGSLGFRMRVGRRELIHFCFQLEQMVNAGIGVLDALRDYAETLPPGRLRDVVSGVAEKIEAGSAFSDALAAYPRVFSALFVDLIRAGERSGELGSVLAHLTESLKWQDEMIARTKKALAYPLFSSIIVLGAVTFMMVYVVPQVTGFILSMEGEIPWHTRLLIAVSHAMVAYWPWLLGMPVAFLVLARFILARSVSARLWFDALKLRLPLLGPVLEKLVMARFAHYLALLFQAGLPVLECFELCVGVVGNAYVARGLAQAREAIARGEPVSEALEDMDLFPRLVIRLIKIGERTGDLGKALASVDYFYHRDVDEAIERMQALIEPTLNLVIGALMGWVMLSVMGPIYDLISQLEF